MQAQQEILERFGKKGTKIQLASEWRQGWEGTRVEQGQESGDSSEQSGMEWSGGCKEVIWEYNL